MTNKNQTVLYVGVTTNLHQRILQHKTGFYKESFTRRYNCHKLVYYCGFPNIGSAIAEEKRLKGGSRNQKIELINSMNPGWKDLWEDIEKW